MISINFLHIHIVCCKNLHSTVKWFWRVTLRSRESYTLGVHFSLGFQRGVLPLPTSWTSHGILVLVQLQWGWVGDESFLSATCILFELSFNCCWSIIEARSTSTTVVEKWRECWLLDLHHDLIEMIHVRRQFNSIRSCLPFAITTFTRDECF